MIVGLAGADVIWAGRGDDTICSGLGADDVYGEEGSDLLLDGGSPYAGSGSGGPGDDVLIGYHVAYGDQGNDILRAGTVTNRVELYGEEGNDLLVGCDFPDPDGSGDWISGGEGDDTLRGRAQYDYLYPGPGNDTIYGGSDLDFLGYQDSEVAMYVSLREGIAYARRDDGTEDPDGKHDLIRGVSQVSGSGFNDHLVGDDAGNVLIGCSGFDVIEGFGGDDFLVGTRSLGCGRAFVDPPDLLDGGDGVDTCTERNLTWNCEYTLPPSFPGDPPNALPFPGTGPFERRARHAICVSEDLPGTSCGRR